MKIAIITNLYEPYARGGAEVIVKNSYEALKKDHDVFLITTRPYSRKSNLKAKREGNIYRFFPLNLFHYPNDYKKNILSRFLWNIFDVFNLHSYFEIKRILNEEQPDLVLTHNLKGIGYLTPHAIKHLKLDHVHTLHDVQLVNPSGLIYWKKEKDSFNESFFVKTYAFINRYLFNIIPTVVSPSKYLLDYYQDNQFFKNSKKKVIRNPLQLKSNTSHSESRKWTEMNYLFLGQIEKHKGIEFLLNTFINYTSKLDSYWKPTLHVVGEGTLLNTLRQQYSEFSEVKFYGKIAHENLPEIFKEMDYMIFPSLCYENSPTVIVESLSQGVPVICSNIGGAPELIKDKLNGFIFEPENTRELMDILHYCKENIHTCDEMKQNCSMDVKNFSSEEYVKKLLEFCKQ